MNEFIRQAKAVSDPSRLRMLKLLENGELCVCDIMAVMGLGQSTASKHLGILKAAGFVQSRKQGTWSYYRLSDTAKGDSRYFLKFVKARLNNDEGVQKDRKLLTKRISCPCRMQGD